MWKRTLKILILKAWISQDSLEKRNQFNICLLYIGIYKISSHNQRLTNPVTAACKLESQGNQQMLSPRSQKPHSKRDAAPVQSQRPKIPLLRCWEATFQGWRAWSLTATGNVGRQTPGAGRGALSFQLDSPPLGWCSRLQGGFPHTVAHWPIFQRHAYRQTQSAFTNSLGIPPCRQADN